MLTMRNMGTTPLATNFRCGKCHSLRANSNRRRIKTGSHFFASSGCFGAGMRHQRNHHTSVGAGSDTAASLRMSRQPDYVIFSAEGKMEICVIRMVCVESQPFMLEGAILAVVTVDQSIAVYSVVADFQSLRKAGSLQNREMLDKSM